MGCESVVVFVVVVVVVVSAVAAVVVFVHVYWASSSAWVDQLFIRTDFALIIIITYKCIRANFDGLIVLGLVIIICVK